MRILRLLSIVALAFLLNPSAALAIDIPEFSPNVVDPDGYLASVDKQFVNEALQGIRESSHIWGAVFIISTLDGEPIENVAVEAFEHWQLGQKGADNGLLLVLAMNDHQSRFEVGYGLEGVIPDVVALRALDAHLAPKLRAGDTAGAIMDAFEFLSRVVAQDPDALLEVDQAQTAIPTTWKRGLIAWVILLFGIWFGFPIRNAWMRRQRRRLLKQDPSLSLDDQHIVKSKGTTQAWKGSWLVQGFLSINPGVFVLLLSADSVAGFLICVSLILLILFLVVHLSARRYGSPERYRRFLSKIARQRTQMIEKGFLIEKSPGVYTYTPAYHASVAASSSSSGSGFSSSSGGGRSGGGGASSSW
ncbi:MAG: TPM domain-containing protein [Gammaproteobacteria bacterium]|nr:TPM domain-containing protein [Gammaproteobacteria bacterium]